MKLYIPLRSFCFALCASALLYTPSILGSAYFHEPQDVQVPVLLLAYDYDALFAQVMIENLKKVNNHVAQAENFWLEGSSRTAIFALLAQAQKNAAAFANFSSYPKLFEKKNPTLYKSFMEMKAQGSFNVAQAWTVNNLPALLAAAKKADAVCHMALQEATGPSNPTAMNSNSCTINYKYTLGRVMRLRYLANRLNTLRFVDGDLEFQGLYPELYQLLNKEKDLKELIEALDEDIEDLKKVWNKSSEQELERAVHNMQPKDTIEAFKTAWRKNSEHNLKQFMQHTHSVFLNRNTH